MSQDQPMTFAYADPVYLGCGKLYAKNHPEAHVWDDPETHRQLIASLSNEFPDGWALSASSTTLKAILPMCPDDVRIAAWAKPFAAYKRNVRIAYTWEPVIFHGGRTSSKDGAGVNRDHLSESITMKKGLTGAKPERFCRWVLDLLGWKPGDRVVDLFPGTGVFDRVVEAATANPSALRYLRADSTEALNRVMLFVEECEEWDRRDIIPSEIRNVMAS